MGIKKNFDVQRDVDHLSCLKLLLQNHADPKIPSINGTLPIFKAVKSSYQTLQIFLDYVRDRAKSINVLDNKGMSPLCKLSS